MKTLGILLIGLGTVLALYLTKSNPTQSLDSTFLLTLSGIFFLIFGMITDKLTSPHNNTHNIKRSR